MPATADFNFDLEPKNDEGETYNDYYHSCQIGDDYCPFWLDDEFWFSDLLETGANMKKPYYLQIARDDADKFTFIFSGANSVYDKSGLRPVIELFK